MSTRIKQVRNLRTGDVVTAVRGRPIAAALTVEFPYPLGDGCYRIVWQGLGAEFPSAPYFGTTRVSVRR